MGANYFLIPVAIVAAAIVVAINLYVLVHFQHPNDRNQSYFPKLVVVLGLSLATWSILLLPLDVANNASCSDAVIRSECDFALPMEELWYAVYMSMFLMVVVVVPWTFFFYEQEEEDTTRTKAKSASLWVTGVVAGLAIILGLCYAYLGFVELPVTSLKSGFSTLAAAPITSASRCIIADAANGMTSAGYACDATGGVTTEEWEVRTTFPVYVIAMSSIAAWFLLMVFGGVGMAAIPIDLLKAYVGRPRKVITKSEYTRIAGKIAEATKAVMVETREVQRMERGAGKSRTTRKKLALINKKLAQLEDDELTLQKMYPQGEDKDATWSMTVIMYHVALLGGVVAALISAFWMLHIVLYMMPDPPVSSFLNEFFIAMDEAWGLFGTTAFATFCFYLILCVIKGNVKIGFRLLLFSVYPMKIGGTLMSSLLFNVNLIMLSSIAVIQFCAQAFDGYAIDTEVSNIFGGEIQNLKGLGVLYEDKVFIYCFFAIACVSFLYLIQGEARGEGKKKKKSYLSASDDA